MRLGQRGIVTGMRLSLGAVGGWFSLAAGLALSFAQPGCKPAPTGAGIEASSAALDLEAETLLYGDAAFKARLLEAVAQKGASYAPRTRHKSADGSPKYNNRLVFETSPYLLQHAHNPVNWFPWGDEAFAVAQKLGRPVFLSVGYSTCHWCHVMEEESFEDETIAKYINDHYVPIKVDREERPDVDAVYLRAVQLMTGQSGGWPMTVWLTPQRKPFYGGTYFPPRDGARGRARGLLTLLTEQQAAFQKDPNAVANDAERIAIRVQSDLKAPGVAGLPTSATVKQAAELATRRYDKEHGGSRGRPKFPSTFPTRFLLRYGLRAGDAASTDMALHTLRKMQAGGMYDHVGGGFHRYTVDERWLVPHFEKMLYDNALLTLAYLDGYQVSGDAVLLRVARETLDYVDREMTAPTGAYFSATDADSLTPTGKREEGYYFTWTPAEIDAALDPDAAKVVRTLYAITDTGNFEGRSILYTPKPRAEVAEGLGLTAAELDATLDRARPLLRTARDKRDKPLLDDKIQVSWSGLMISAMARGASVLDEPRYRRNAEKAARFLLEKLVVGGRLHHAYRAGKTTGLAFAEDYAFFAAGLIDLFEASQDPTWLGAAISMMDLLEEHHRAEHTGGFYRTADDHEKLLAREVETRDGAIPSAGSVAAMNELRLWTLTTLPAWRTRAETTLKGYASVLETQPWAMDEMMLAVDYFTDSPKEIVLALPEGMASDAQAADPMLRAMWRSFVPNRVFVIASPGRLAEGGLAALVPWASDKPAKGDRPTAYVCELGACDLPTADPAVFAKQIGKLIPYGQVR